MVFPFFGSGRPSPSHLLLVAGQSNALAQGVGTPTSAVAAINSSRVKIWTGNGFSGYVAGTNSEPTGAQATKWGPEAQYAIRWLADNPIGTLYIVKRAVGGTAISTWQYGQTNFNNMTAWVVAAKTALLVSGISFGSQKLIWTQGESDAIVDQATADAYHDKLVATLASARTYWGPSTMKAGVARIYDANMTYRATVRAAQESITTADAYSTLVNTDDFTLVDTYHYNSASVVTFGDRMYDAVA